MSRDLLKRVVKRGASRSIASFKILLSILSLPRDLSSSASLRASLTLYSTIAI
jgi:hypothetical protein